MTQPTPYLRQFAFLSWSEDFPTLPHSGQHMDTEFDAVKTTIDQVLVNMALLQRDDAKLHNGIVGVDSLSSEVVSLIGNFLPRGAWVTATAYAVRDVVSVSGIGYVCRTAHTSGVFATDLAALKWAAVYTAGIAVDGSSTVTANIPFNSKRITGLGDGVSGSDAVNKTQSETFASAAAAAAAAAVAVTAASVTETRAGTNTAKFITPDDLAALWQAATPIVSAASISKPADADLGGFYSQTGATATDSYWAGVKDGEEMEIRYAAAPSLTIAGNLLPPGGAAFQTIADDIVRWRWDAALTKWRAVGGMRADGTALVVRRLPTFSAHKNATNQTGIVSATATKLTFTTETEDIGAYYDAANSKWTPPAGVVQINAAAFFSAGANIVDQAIYFVAIYKNGVVLKCGIQPTASGTTNGIGSSASCRDRASGTDYYEVYAYGGGAGAKTIDGTSSNTWFDGVWLGA